MPTNSKEYSKEYMRKYIKESESINCDICEGKYKRYSRYVHNKSKRHLNAIAGNLLTDKVNEMNELKIRLNKLELIVNNKQI